MTTGFFPRTSESLKAPPSLVRAVMSGAGCPTLDPGIAVLLRLLDDLRLHSEKPQGLDRPDANHMLRIGLHQFGERIGRGLVRQDAERAGRDGPDKGILVLERGS